MILATRRQLVDHRRHRLRYLSTVVDVAHLTNPVIDLDSLPESKPALLSRYTITPPVSPWPRHPSPKRIGRLIRSQRDPQTALAIFHHAANFTPNFSHNYDSYLALVERLARSRHLDPIPSVLSSLRASRLRCGEQLFITLIKAYATASKPTFSLKTFLSIPSFGVATSVRAFNALLNAMIQNKRYDLVPTLFNNCRSKFGIAPNVFTCNILVKALCDVGKIGDALKVLDEMPEWGMVPNVVTYTTVIGFHCARGDLAEAKELFDEARGKGLSPDVRTYTVLIDGYCRAGRVADAVRVMDDMEADGVLPNEATYTVVVLACCKGKRSGEALSLIRDMLDGRHVPSSSLCCKVIDALCEDGKVEDACEIWRKLLKKNVTPDNSVSSTLIYWLCKAGKIWEARKLFDEFERGFIPSVLTYNTLISGMCENGELQEAGRLWDDMVERRCHPNVFTYNVLIKGFCKVGEAKEAVGALEEMLEKGCVPNKLTYRVLVDGLLECGDGEEALEVLGDLASRRGELLDEDSWDVFVRKVVADAGVWRKGLREVLLDM